MSNKTGGQAFPMPSSSANAIGAEEWNSAHFGMTLRDYFAVHASEEAIGLGEATTISHCAKLLGITVDEYNQDPFGNYCKLLSKRRYAYADAMLAERAK
jgi:hypothetical protein